MKFILLVLREGRKDRVRGKQERKEIKGKREIIVY